MYVESLLLSNLSVSAPLQLDRYATVCFTGLIGTFLACSICELRWSKVSFEAWWRNEQFWVIAGTSAHLAAVLQVRETGNVLNTERCKAWSPTNLH